MEKLVSSKSVKYLYLFFIGCAFGSFCYSFFNGRYNGDFLGMEVKLPFLILLLNLFFSILPFFITWKIYNYFKRKPIKKQITIPMNFFAVFLILVIIWNIIVTILFGVGIMAAPPYEAPPVMKAIIQVMNRFNYIYGVLLYFLTTDKKNKMQFLLLFMLVFLCFLRAGLGVVLYIAMFSLIKYFDEISEFCRKRKPIIITLVLLFPFFVSLLFDFRSMLRNQEEEGLTGSHLIFGRVLGRLSSFSDSAIILQEPAYFFIRAQQLDDYYFQKQALAGVFSMDLMPSPRPEQTLFWLYGPASEKNVSYMPGTQGNLYFALLKSVKTLVMNMTTIFIFIFLTFWFCRLLRFKYSNEFAFTLLLYVLLSGVPNEYSFLAFSIFVYVLVFLVVNGLSFKSRPRNLTLKTSER